MWQVGPKHPTTLPRPSAARTLATQCRSQYHPGCKRWLVVAYNRWLMLGKAALLLHTESCTMPLRSATNSMHATATEHCFLWRFFDQLYGGCAAVPMFSCHATCPKTAEALFSRLFRFSAEEILGVFLGSGEIWLPEGSKNR